MIDFANVVNEHSIIYADMFVGPYWDEENTGVSPFNAGIEIAEQVNKSDRRFVIIAVSHGDNPVIVETLLKHKWKFSGTSVSSGGDGRPLMYLTLTRGVEKP